MMVGIQESKCKHHIAATAGPFMVFASCATSTPAGGTSGGCELWLHRGLDVTEAPCCTLVSQPDLLVVRVACGAQRLLCLVGHAPTAASGDDVIAAWWERLILCTELWRQPSDTINRNL